MCALGELGAMFESDREGLGKAAWSMVHPPSVSSEIEPPTIAVRRPICFGP